MRKLIRIAGWIAAVVLAVPAILFALWLFQGSLEMFPTEEQQDKVRTVAGLGFVIFTTIDTAIILALWKSK